MTKFAFLVFFSIVKYSGKEVFSQNFSEIFEILHQLYLDKVCILAAPVKMHHIGKVIMLRGLWRHSLNLVGIAIAIHK